MVFNVRMFGHRGTRQFPQLIPTQFTSAISEALFHPYDWMQLITTNGNSPVSSQLVGPQLFGFNDQAALIVIEVPDGQVVRYEFNAPARLGGFMINGVFTQFLTGTPAGNNSPTLTGRTIFAWTPGTILSFVEASFFP
jgi:hypothetical protein